MEIEEKWRFGIDIYFLCLESMGIEVEDVIYYGSCNGDRTDGVHLFSYGKQLLSCNFVENVHML